MQRRDFLSQCMVAPSLLGFVHPLFAKSQRTSSSVAYMAAAQSRLGEYSLQCFNSQNELIASHDIASRGHGFALSTQGHIAAVARRPADFFLILDASGTKLFEFYAHEDRHFYGHGVFDTTGNYLYLTENDFKRARGVIGVYDARKNYARVNEFESYGVGPHQIELDNTGQQLIVANGGIETHPQTGRKKLNLESMQPSLAFIDVKTGGLLKNAQLPAKYHKNSLRHFSIASDDTVYIGLQNEGEDQSAALIATLRPSSSLIEKVALPESAINQLSNYVGDICLDQSEQFLALSSPYGNTLMFVSLATEQVKCIQMVDVCAVSNTNREGEFIVSSGTGKIYSAKVSNANLQHVDINKVNDFSAQQSWDNHLLTIS